MEKKFDIQNYTEPSFSFLKNLNERDGCPALALYKKENPDDSYFMHEGRVVDTAFLEPDKFDDRYIVTDRPINRDGQDFKFCLKYAELIADMSAEKAIEQAKEETGHRYKIETLAEKLENGWGEYLSFIENDIDKEPVAPDLYEKVMRARDLVFRVSPLPDYMQGEGVEIQKKLRWQNPTSGITCRGIADVAMEKSFVLDLKKTRSAAPGPFAGRWGEMRKFNIIEQVAAYSEALGRDFDTDVKCFVFAVQLDPTPLWGMYELSKSDIFRGEDIFAEWCLKFKYIQENDLWHMGYEFGTMYQWDSNEGNFFLRNPSMIAQTDVYYDSLV